MDTTTTNPIHDDRFLPAAPGERQRTDIDHMTAKGLWICYEDAIDSARTRLDAAYAGNSDLTLRAGELRACAAATKDAADYLDRIAAVTP